MDDMLKSLAITLASYGTSGVRMALSSTTSTVILPKRVRNVLNLTKGRMDTDEAYEILPGRDITMKLMRNVPILPSPSMNQIMGGMTG